MANQTVITTLVIINVAVFVLQNASPQVTDMLSLSVNNLRDFQIWRLLTYGFCHSMELNHLVFNMIGLWLFGRVVEPIYGHREFLWFYLTSIVISGLCHVMFQLGQGLSNPVIGASGGVYAVTILAAIHFPRMTILFMMIFPLELRWLAVLYIGMDLYGMMHGGSNVANAAHLGGAAFAALYHYNGWRLTGLMAFRGFKLHLPKRRPKVQIYHPESNEQDIDMKVDALLQKIHREGEASLTDDERQILKNASRQYKERR
ncbi:MAG: rhomboid family intramembrane serine protease [Planctomycetota bacterium]|nr:rhomboid family intramembrane serine protease [Planctomycetota bacterium]MDA1212339.1 rhomboid family intramembrane serine protease [Planctomycetota bacterium]